MTRLLRPWVPVLVLLASIAVLAQVPQPPSNVVVNAPGIWVLTPSSAAVVVGGTVQITSASGSNTTWISNNPAIATVSPSGLVTGVSAGVVTILARKDNKNGQTIITVLTPPPTSGSLSVPLTVQEALYDGVHGTARSNEPFCMGVPLADTAALTTVASLGLSNAVAGQFRALSTWPSGHLKWVKTCGLVQNLTAGGTTSVTLTDSGSGNFGGSNLATDNGATITIATGAATFTVKKAHYNVLDTVVIGATTVVATSAAEGRGLIVMGPAAAGSYPTNVTCGTCTTVFSSANDASSTASIEENGPVMTVIRAVGTHKDSSNNPYMQFTQRLTFYKGKTGVKVVTSLRNANYSTAATPSADRLGGTFNTSWKGLQAYELRLQPNISGTTTYAFDAVGTQTSTISGTDSTYLYQGAANWMGAVQDVVICGPGSICGDLYTTDQGFIAKKNSTTLATGTVTGVPQGWADIRDTSGVGMMIGMYEFAASWPASLEFTGGGTEARIGLFSARNSRAIYQPWPAWTTKEAYLDFHTTTPTSFVNNFYRLQHPLIARADRVYYNTTQVFPYALPDPADEDAFMSSLDNVAVPTVAQTAFCYGGGTTNCTPDRSATNATTIANAMAIGVYKAYVWPTGGPLNQEEFRWSDMLRYLGRGQTGRWINSRNFYQFAGDRGMFPHADGTSTADSTVNGFTWRSRPHANAGLPEVGGNGFPIMSCNGSDAYTNPCVGSVNSDQSVVSYSMVDFIHNHWSGITDYYMLTGDELVREALEPVKDFYINVNTYQGVTDPSFGTGFPTRAVGIFLIGASNYSIYLRSISDSNWTSVRDEGKVSFVHHVKTDTCISGYPVGCTPVTVNTYPSVPDNEPAGVNRKRGVHTSNSFRGTYRCTNAMFPGGIPAYYRAQSSFQSSILVEGLLALTRATDISEWSDYRLARDLAYGVSQWGLTESFSDDGLNHWYVGGGTSAVDSLYNGWRFGIQFDATQICNSPGDTAEPGTTTIIGGVNYMTITLADGIQGQWMHLLAQAQMNGVLTTNQIRQMKFGLDWVGVRRSVWPADYGGYQLGGIIASIYDPPTRILTDVPFTVSALGSGNYRLSWTVPAGAESYRIKWSPLTIAPSTALLNFNPISFTFGTNPATTDTWFGAQQVTEPSPGTAGTTQTTDISTGQTGLGAANFSVKAYLGPNGGGGGDPGTTPIITWSAPTTTGAVPGANGFLSEHYDATSGQILHYGILGNASTIYSTNMFAYRANTQTWTNLGGNSNLSNSCASGTYPPFPPNRHPGQQMAVDTVRHRLWLLQGVCQPENRLDFYYYTLNTNPTTNTWTQVVPATNPNAGSGGFNAVASMVYSPDDDVLFLFGFDGGSNNHDHWVYCPSSGGLSSAQAAVGCARANDWTEITPVGGVIPPGVQFHSMVYIGNHQVLSYGGANGANSIVYNQTWIYNLVTKTWTRKCLTGCTPPPLYVGPQGPPTWPIVYAAAQQKVLYHQQAGGGSPQDWMYDPAGDTWTKLVSSGSGPTVEGAAAYDPVNHIFMIYTQNAGVVTIWHGLVSF